MASPNSVRLRGWRKAKEDLTEALMNISKVADQEALEDEAELQQLRLRSAKVDDLQQENDRLRSQLETALKKRRNTIPASDEESSDDFSPASQKEQSRTKALEEQLPPRRSTQELFKEFITPNVFVRKETDLQDQEFPEAVPPNWSPQRVVEKYNELMPKYTDLLQQLDVLRNEKNDLQQNYDQQEGRSKVLLKNHEEVIAARKRLEDKARKTKEVCKNWLRYADSKDKKIAKLKAKLASLPYESKSPKLPPNKTLKASENDMITAPPSSDGDYPPQPSPLSSPPSGPPRLITPVSVFSNRNLDRLRMSSPAPESSLRKGLGRDRANQLRLPITTSDEHQISHPSPQLPVAHHGKSTVTTDFDEPDDSRDVGALMGEAILPADFDEADHEEADHEEADHDEVDHDEADQELPRLKDSEGAAGEESAHTSSTQGEPYLTQQAVPTANSPVLKWECDSSPVLVSTTRVKKPKTKRADPSNTEVIPTVKVEDLTSSPVDRAVMDFGESMDLDDHPHMVTPKKRRTPRNHENLVVQNTLDDPFDLESGTEAVHSRAVLVERSPDRPAKRSNALQPLNSNKKLVRQDGQPPQKRRRRESLPRGSGSLAENDENFQDLLQEASKPKPQKFAGILSESLAKPRTKAATMSPDPVSRLAKSAQRAKLTPKTSPRRSRYSKVDSNARDVIPGSLPAKILSKLTTGPKIASSGDIYEPPTSSPEPPTIQISRVMKPPPKKVPAPRLDSPVDDRPENEPLRCRPMEKLRLDDFKINPRFNQGYTYAFGDVVRGKEARRCLPGCQRTCCGPHWRRLAEMTVTSRDGAGPLSEKTQESDKRALMGYLGDDYIAYERYGPAHKQETLIKAMAWQLAQDNGKHRGAYLPQNSPPGFWDMEFPMTQKLEEDRRKAREAEREQIEERFRQAMRPNGTYMFRDE